MCVEVCVNVEDMYDEVISWNIKGLMRGDLFFLLLYLP